MKRGKTRFLIVLLILSLFISSVIYVGCLPLLYLGSDPDDDEEDSIDIKEAYCRVDDDNITFVIVTYGEIKTHKNFPTSPDNEFQVCLDVRAGQGDNRPNILFDGADVIVTAHNGEVYYWDGGKWKENKTASVQAEVHNNNLTITCRLSDIRYEQVSGDLGIGFISNLNKVGAKEVNEGRDRAPDSGWYTLEGGVSDIGLLENLLIALSGFILVYTIRRIEGNHSERA